MTANVTIRIPMPLRSFTSGASEVKVEAATVAEALEALGRRHEGIIARVLSPEGEPRQFVNLFIGAHNIRSLDGLGTRLKEGDVVSIVPAVAGGAWTEHGKRSDRGSAFRC